LNMGQKCATALRHLEDARRFQMAVATTDVPRVRQLVDQAMKDGSSLSAITSKIELAGAGLYEARGYDETDYDIALLILRSGGRALLHSLSEQTRLPSVRQLKRENIFTRIIPSSEFPTDDEILFNLREVFAQKRRDLASLGTPRVVKSGVVMLWDEISMEEVACYLRHSDSVGGLCREHAGTIRTRLTTYEDAEAIARALADGDVHYGSECSVIAISSFSTDVRGAFPVVVSPTCKKETPAESATIASKIIACWDQVGAADFGKLWSFASDGDAGRQQMVYNLFMTHVIDSKHPLYKLVGRLPGLNLNVGIGDITADFDWKHELKRMMRLLLTQEGVLINQTILNVESIRRQLRRDPSLSEHDIAVLTKPTDTQDVPRAVRFLDTLANLASLPPSDDPTEFQEATYLSVVAEMFHSFMLAFIQVDWSLSQQLTSLSKYAHMAFVLFSRQGINTMPHQLYGDTQCTVKNAFMCVAKQQLLDGTQPFYLFWLGDDRLEALFGIIRMLGAHNPNFSLLQLLDRIGAALDIDAVYTRHPKLHPGHRRLKVNTAEKADHLNPESWLGDACANNVNLESVWLRGSERALAALRRISICDVDLHRIFDKTRILDMLRPWGDGKYPGCSREPDRSVEPLLPSAAPPESLPDLPPSCSSLPPGSMVSSVSSIHSEYLSAPLESLALRPAESESEPNPVPSCRSGDSLIPPQALPSDPAPSRSGPVPHVSDSARESSPNVELDSSLAFEDAVELPSTQQLPFSPGITNPSPWIEYKGKKIHKATICRPIITPEYARKSHERILRVRGFSSDGQKWKLEFDEVIHTSAFVVGDLFVTLVRCGNQASLAVLKCIAIEEKGIRVDRIDGRKLRHPASGIKLYGQVLDMRNVNGLPSEDDTAGFGAERGGANSDAVPDGNPDPSHWVWTGDFVKLAPNQDRRSPAAPTTKAARKTVAVKVGGHICKPVNPDICDMRQWLSTSDTSFPNLNPFGRTWKFSRAELDIIAESVWDTIQEHQAVSALPVFQHNSGFPYRDTAGNPGLVSDRATATLQLESDQKNNKFRCYVCHTEMDPSKARTHVGGHILKAKRGVVEPEPKGEPVGQTSPCGFCGRSGLQGCQQLFLTKTSQARSECRHFHKFHYRPAKVSTETTPCTNIPIMCTVPGCKSAMRQGDLFGAIWKYNMEEHIKNDHSGYSTTGVEDHLLPIPADLAREMYISDSEERLMGISDSLIPHKIAPLPDDNNSVLHTQGKQSRADMSRDHVTSSPALGSRSTKPPSKRKRT
ncbi:hypothetical protein LXA43DRAFT_900727, partial [Ganoderma leucocontextum]